MAVKVFGGILAAAALCVLFSIPAKGELSEGTQHLKTLMTGLNVLRKLMDFEILPVPEGVTLGSEQGDFWNNMASLAGIHEYLPRLENLDMSEDVAEAGETLSSAACEWLKTTLDYTSEDFDCTLEMTKLGKEIAVRNTTKTIYTNLRQYAQVYCGDNEECLSLRGWTDEEWLENTLNTTDCITEEVFQVLQRLYPDQSADDYIVRTACE